MTNASVPDERLLPCPFCGCPDPIERHSYYFCACDAMVPKESWNRRASMPTGVPAERLEKLQRYNGIEKDTEGVYIMLDDALALAEAREEGKPGTGYVCSKCGKALYEYGEGWHAISLQPLSLCGPVVPAPPASVGTEGRDEGEKK